MRVLICGKSSYIGARTQRALTKRGHTADAVSVRENGAAVDLFGYDAVIFCAALVHRKERKDEAALYDDINRRLPADFATRAKTAGVGQFVFLSSWAIYGKNGAVGGECEIREDTEPAPVTLYGRSKLDAELALTALSSPEFTVAVLRIPAVYGDGAPGNPARLRKLARCCPIFPKADNRRGRVDAEALAVALCAIVERRDGGTLHCCDGDLPSTSRIYADLRAEMGKRTRLSPFLGKLVTAFGKRIGVVQKLFGNLTIDENLIYKV